MTSLKKHNKGFTIVELLIVIVVIAILALLIIRTYGSIQAKTRNSTRQTDIQNIQQKLEAYFSQNGYYPSLTDMNRGTSATTSANSTWVAQHMKSLNQADLADPSNPKSSKQLKASPQPKWYSYKVTDSNGNSCEQDDTTCAKYTLTATYEGTVSGDSDYTKVSLD